MFSNKVIVLPAEQNKRKAHFERLSGIATVLLGVRDITGVTVKLKLGTTNQCACQAVKKHILFKMP